MSNVVAVALFGAERFIAGYRAPQQAPPCGVGAADFVAEELRQERRRAAQGPVHETEERAIGDRKRQEK